MRPRLFLLLLCVAIAVAATILAGYFTYQLRLSELRQAADERLSLKSQNVITEVERYRYLPFLVARDQRIEQLLDRQDDPVTVGQANRYLEAANGAAGSLDLFLLNDAGKALAASNWKDGTKSFVGQSYGFRTYFKDAMATGSGSEYGVGFTTGIPGYFLAQRLETAAGNLGVAVVKVDMSSLEKAWGDADEQAGLADRSGMIFLSSVADWRFRPLYPLLEEDRRRILADRQQYPASSIDKTSLLGKAQLNPGGDAYLLFQGKTLLVRLIDIPREGWRIMAGHDVAPVYDWAYLTATIVLLTAALLFAIGFYLRERGQRNQVNELRAILENMSVGLAVFDANRRLLAWNSKYLTLNSYAESLIRPGRPLVEIIQHNIRRGDFGRGDPEAQLQERLSHTLEETVPFEAARPDGTWVEITRSRMPRGRFIHTYSDITERKHTAAELDAHRNHLEQLVEHRTAELVQLNDRLQKAVGQTEAAKRDAEQANRAKTIFLNAVSHDIRNPLNAILGYASLVKAGAKECLPLRQYENLEKLSARGRELNELVSDFLDYTRADQVTTSAFPLSRIIEDCLATIDPMVNAGQVRILCEIPGDLPELVQDDRKLRRILMNLLGNAAKFTEKGSIRVTARRHDESMEVSVADTGIGIAEEFLGGIFDEFGRIEPPGQRPREGTGLGLAICRRFAAIMAGEITVRSRPGEGSIFTLLFPIIHPKTVAVGVDPMRTNRQEPSPVMATAHADAANSFPTVLIVDDSKENRDYLVQLLEPNYHVLVAADGKRAVELAQLERPNLILMDLSLPIIDGWEATRRIKANPVLQPIPIVAITAHVTKRDQDEASAAGCDGFLAKPVEEATLLDILRRFLPPRRAAGR